MSFNMAAIRKNTSVRGPVGLLNNGNLCYAISVLQCLTYTPLLAAYCNDRKHSLNCKGKSPCLVCLLLKRIERSLNEPNCPQAELPGDITENLSLVGSHFSKETQEDAQEFCMNLINACEKLDPYVYNIFKAILVTHIKCSFCGYKSDKEENSIGLSVGIQNYRSVEEGLNELLHPQDKLRCEHCHNPSSFTTQIQIRNPSDVLIIHLKRFDGNINKIKRNIEFLESIELQKYMDSSSSSASATETLFQLYAIIVHIGESTSSGHYVAYVKTANGDWYQCDDGKVKKVSIEFVLNQSAYLLFYHRRTDDDGYQTVTRKKKTSKSNLALKEDIPTASNRFCQQTHEKRFNLSKENFPGLGSQIPKNNMSHGTASSWQHPLQNLNSGTSWQHPLQNLNSGSSFPKPIKPITDPRTQTQTRAESLSQAEKADTWSYKRKLPSNSRSLKALLDSKTEVDTKKPKKL